jgi:hypothetical protein
MSSVLWFAASMSPIVVIFSSSLVPPLVIGVISMSVVVPPMFLFPLHFCFLALPCQSKQLFPLDGIIHHSLICRLLLLLNRQHRIFSNLGGCIP